jgi:hypothetical protein
MSEYYYVLIYFVFTSLTEDEQILGNKNYLCINKQIFRKIIIHGYM